MEKSIPNTTVSVVDSEESHELKPISKWSPGYYNRVPYFGVVGLSCIAIFACASLGVLVGSNHVSTSKWSQSFAPNVLISVFNALGSLGLAVAVSEGIAIAWWRHAMKGATVKELHEQWELSGGVINALLFRPRSVLGSSIALAMLATQVTVLNSILYQASTTTYTAPDPPKPLSAVAIAAQEFPTTGYVVSNTSFAAQTACECFMIGDSYTPVVNNWQTANGFFSGYNELFRFSDEKAPVPSKSLQYCNGICLGSFEAIGFEIDCQQSQNHTDIAIAAIDAYNTKGNASAWTNLPIFNSSFALEYSTEERNYSQISIDLQYFQSDNPYDPSPKSCPGKVFKRQCSLRPAIISYPVKVTNFTNEHIVNGVQLMSPNVASPDDQMLNDEMPPPAYNSQLKQAEGFSVVRYIYTQDDREIRSLTQLGGIANAISQVLSSTAAITYTGVDESWSLSLLGTLAGRMMYGPPNMGSCDCSFQSNSLDIIIASINQLTFLTATGMVDTSSFRGLPKNKTPFPSTLPQAPVVAVDRNYTATFAAAPTDATQLTDVVHYKTRFIPLGFAFGITMLCILLVLPAFWHYGELGRRVTLGPVEIASAFGAPILVDNTHAKEGAEPGSENIDSLIKRIGDRKIVYGFVDVEDVGKDHGRPEMHLETGGDDVNEHADDTTPVLKSPTITTDWPLPSPTQDRPVSNLHKRRSVRLAMAPPERVLPPSAVFPLPKSPLLEQAPKSPKIGQTPKSPGLEQKQTSFKLESMAKSPTLK